MGPSATRAQVHDSPAVNAKRLAADQTIRIDGHLDEAAWGDAPLIGRLTQREPDVGNPARDSTAVRVLYDGHSLYVGVTAWSSVRPVARILQRDRILQSSAFSNGFRTQSDDVIAILLDPFHDRRAAYVFATNPNGAELEALLSNDGQETNLDWRTVWQVKTVRFEGGWSAEFEIPFRSIRYPSGAGGVWGFNLMRYVASANEESVWTSWSRDNQGFHRVSLAGHIRGLDDLPRAGLNLEAKPYLLTGLTRTVDDGVAERAAELDLGIDFKWELTPGLLLDATANTDFAQVEVDNQRVNLTRFSLFYPEKREFFLENAGLFEFGWRGAGEPPPFLMFFSRRIGLVDDGAVPILGGARLTGRVGRQSIGVLDVVTDDAFGVPRTNHSVVRIRREVGGAGFVGAMMTDQRSAAGSQSSIGIDWLARPLPTLTVQGFAAGTRQPGGAGDGLAGRVAMDYQTDKVGASVSHLFVGRDATADLGFVTRTGVHRIDYSATWAPRPRALGLRRVELGLYGNHVLDIEGRALDQNIGPSLNPRWNDGSSVYVWAGFGSTALDEAFELSERVLVPAGRYDMSQLGWFANTSTSRPVVLRSDGLLQWVYGGRIGAASVQLDLAPSSRLGLTLRWTHNRVDLPAGAFSAELASFRLTAAASPQLVANALVQYNELANTVDANFRIAYTFRPGSDLYLVINEQRGNDTRLWAAGDRAALLKLTWLSRF